VRFKDVRRKITWPLTNVVLIILKVIARLMPFRALGFVARSIGAMLLLKPGNKKMILANLAIAFPDVDEAERRRICRESTKNMCLTFLEFLWIRSNVKKISTVSRFSPHGEELLKAYREKDEGLMVISPHIGNWEMGNFQMNGSGYHSSAVAKKPDNPFTASLIDEGRKLSGVEIIYEQGAAKGMMRALKKGETVVILIDQNTSPKKGGVFVDFFGLPVAVSRAPVSFARRCNANILMARCIRKSDGCTELDFRELPKPVADYSDDDVLCRAIMEMHEEFVSESPEQYLWLYNRFRYIPSNWKGDRSRYPYYHRIYDMGEDA